ncbi:hypothetical protein EPICR_180033 [Candidatus Desulfarcum epimagneticum]|uniref:Uncharacterized protein n=1 Tax=uncultured Desulfobacteraceae bacterium TaxID=218296 RepID=A0A484HG56_9BACT|nr:hypothetical protein EPICR_180033 [uncultured Desulfobacteraceae bacterium]
MSLIEKILHARHPAPAIGEGDGVAWTSDIFRFLASMYESAARLIADICLSFFNGALNLIVSRYDILLFGLACMAAGALAALGLRKFFSRGHDVSSPKLKEMSASALEQIMAAIKHEFTHDDPSREFLVLPRVSKLERKKREIEKKITDRKQGRVDAEEISIPRAQTEARKLENRINRLIYQRRKTYDREIRIAKIVNRRTEKVPTLLTGKLSYADFKGREARLGIKKLKGHLYIALDHILHRGRLPIRPNDEIEFELRLIPSPGTVIDIREKKIEGRKEFPVMRYKARLTAFLPLRFPRGLKKKGAALVKKRNQKYQAIAEASLHYVSGGDDREQAIRNLSVHPERVSALIKDAESGRDFIILENASSKNRLFDSSLDILTLMTTERGALRIDMLDAAREIYHFETELYKPVSRLHKVISEFICPLLRL